jgi:HEAT repeat protein
MPSARGVDRQIEEVARLASEGPTPKGKQALAGFLGSKSNLVAARAAEVVRKWAAPEFVENLLDLWDRCFLDPVKTDKGCLAKLAVVEALDAIGHDDLGPFLRGARHVQLEPAYGPPVDSAAELRVACAEILASRGYPDIYVLLADHLMDDEPGVRGAAGDLLSRLGGERAELLLRMRIHAGEDHTENYAAYFRGLLELSPELSVPLVESHCHHENPAVAEEAILALGESRLPEAFPILKSLFSTTVLAEARRVIVLAISLLRLPEAVGFLEEVVREGDSTSARLAVEGMGIYRGSPEIIGSIRAAAEARGDHGLVEVLEEVVGE